MNDNKRIAINTIFLYLKFIITTLISFITSRLILQALGASDYGLYNVVGGIVILLNTLGNSMVATSYRYLAVEIGKGCKGNPNKVYNTVFVIHIILALFLIGIGETLGVLYVNSYLNITPSKIPDALFVLHLSLITTAFSVLTIPMSGLIIAREKFLFTSSIEVLCSILKIFFIYLICNFDGNRLRYYAIILAIIQFITPFAYQLYCIVYDSSIIKWKFNYNKQDYKDLFGFSWWILCGAVAVLGKIQGVAMIINFFFGTILNAAFGLASQVNQAVSNFTSTLRQATIPQIMKNQGGGNEQRAMSLVYATSRYSYLSMNIVAIPLLISIQQILKLWLGDVPEYTGRFAGFMLISGMISNLGAGFDASIQATGKIRKNQIGYSIINLSILPIVYFLYCLKFPPYINVICMMFIAIATLIFQIYIMTELTTFAIKDYLEFTLYPSIKSTILATIPLILIRYIIPDTIWATLLFIIIAIIWTCISIYIYGITPNEKCIISNYVINIINRLKINNSYH